jgi:soluble lytic murein transglycosylase-like protein
MKMGNNLLLMLSILGYSLLCGYFGNEQKVNSISITEAAISDPLTPILDFGLGHRSQPFVRKVATSASSDLTRSQINELIESAASYKVDPALVRAVVSVESGFNHRAVAPDGGRGLMQLMPKTADWLGAKDAMDPVQNLQAGTRYLKFLLEKFNNRLELAIAAYNAGPGAVAEYNDIPPYPQTRQYVRKVMALYRASPPVQS